MKGKNVMNTKDNNEYVSRQISVYKTDKKTCM